MKKFFALILGMSLLILNSGCREYHHHIYHQYPEGSHYESGHSHYSASFGELQSIEKISLNRAWSAATDAMLELGFIIVKRQKNVYFASVFAKGIGDRSVKIDLKKHDEELTEIWIWVDRLGDESLSRLILDKIRARA